MSLWRHLLNLEQYIEDYHSPWARITRTNQEMVQKISSHFGNRRIRKITMSIAQAVETTLYFTFKDHVQNRVASLTYESVGTDCTERVSEPIVV